MQGVSTEPIAAPAARPGPPDGASGYRLLSLLEAPRPRRIALSPHATTLVVATVCLGAFMGQLDASIVSVALPRLGSGLHVGLGAVEWVSLTYVLVLVALLAPIGSWADAVGRKSLYVAGFAVFAAASAGCAMAPDLAALLGCRAVQAVGAAMLQANSAALIASAVPPHRLGRAVGIQAAAQGIGLAAGPAIGGALLALGSWRLLFLVNVPMGVLGCLTGAALLPRSRDLAPLRRVDPVGIVGFVTAAAAMLLSLSLVAGRHRLLAVPVVIVAAGLVAAVSRQQRRTRHPLIDSSLARAAGIRGCLVASFLAYAALFGTLVVVPLYLTRLGLTAPARIGVELAALPIGLGLLAPVAGSWADRRPARVAGGGLTVAALSLAVLAATRPRGAGLVLLLSALGAGLGAFMPANNRRLLLAAPPRTAGAATGLLNTARGLGIAAGTAVAVVGFTTVAGGRELAPGIARDGFSVAAGGLALCCVAAWAAGRR